MFGRFLSRFDLSCPSPPGQSVALHPFSSYFRVPTYLPYVRLTAYILVWNVRYGWNCVMPVVGWPV